MFAYNQAAYNQDEQTCVSGVKSMNWCWMTPERLKVWDSSCHTLWAMQNNLCPLLFQEEFPQRIKKKRIIIHKKTLTLVSSNNLWTLHIVSSSVKTTSVIYSNNLLQVTPPVTPLRFGQVETLTTPPAPVLYDWNLAWNVRRTTSARPRRDRAQYISLYLSSVHLLSIYLSISSDLIWFDHISSIWSIHQSILAYGISIYDLSMYLSIYLDACLSNDFSKCVYPWLLGKKLCACAICRRQRHLALLHGVKHNPS